MNGCNFTHTQFRQTNFRTASFTSSISVVAESHHYFNLPALREFVLKGYLAFSILQFIPVLLIKRVNFFKSKSQPTDPAVSQIDQIGLGVNAVESKTACSQES